MSWIPCSACASFSSLEPDGQAEILFLTGAAEDREAALELTRPFLHRAPEPAQPAATIAQPASAASPIADGAGLRLFNGYGGFSQDGREYVVRLPWDGSALRRPPQPWINVVANERAGFLVSETGAGYTWCRNSQANRLTPWFNDPVRDPHGEALYLRDEASGAAWSPLPGPLPAPADYEVRHGFGYSQFRCDHAGIEQESTLFVPREDPVRILRLRLTHRGAGQRALSVFSYQQLVLGSQPSLPGAIVTTFDAQRDLLRAVNPAAGDFAGAIVFAGAWVEGAHEKQGSFTCDRVAFIGRHRDLADPHAVVSGADLDGRVGEGLEPCFARQLRIDSGPRRDGGMHLPVGRVFERDGAR
jgi:N,N'-diacetylchitobiose phosphorylase